MSKNAALPYLPGLDGLRALAVLAVFFYHAGFLWAVGGFLGVESFFVISGYLITALLLQEYLQTGKLDLPRFWLRRARRLLPALWLLLLAVLPFSAVLAPDSWLRLREDLLAALVYVTNWVYIAREIPYFEQFNRPPLLQHLWSLAVEEQFYLFYPPLLWGLLVLQGVRRPHHLQRLLPAFTVLITGSAALMAFLYNPNSDPARVYYGSDTRAAGFLIGAALAVLWQPGRRVDNARSRRVLEIFSGAALLGLLTLYVRLDEFSPLLYRGGFVFTALLTGFVILAAAVPQSLLARVLGMLPLRWLGTRSYAMYLWHWVVMQFNRYGLECGLSAWGCAAVNFALTLLLAEISYRLVENPIRRQGIGAWFAGWRQRIGLPASVGVLALVGTTAFLSGVYLARQPAPPQRDAAILWVLPSLTPSPTPPPTPSATASSSQLLPLVPSDLPGALPAPVPGSTPSSTPLTLQFTLIGDSVLEGTRSLWEQRLPPQVYVLDAHRSRKLSDLPVLLETLHTEGKLAPVVVLHIGTNRPFDAVEFDDLMKTLLDYGVTRVLWVNVHRPVPWEATINQRIAEGVSRWQQAELIDWHAASAAYPGWFGDDQTHLTRTGAQAYVELILEAISASP